MEAHDEAVSPATDAAAPPTPAAVLGWVAAAGGKPWFPSRHAAASSSDRDALDEPLWQLRLAGLIKVATWVRGAGQGFVLTPEGQAAAATGVGIPGASATDPLPAEPPPAIPDLAPEERAVTRFGLDIRPPILVPVLLAANLFWFGAGLVAAIRGGYPVGGYLGGSHPVLLHRLGAVTGLDLLAGEWWRLTSACFVHIGLLHLFVNMLALAMMGPLAELLWGRWRLAVIYFFSGLGGSCLAMAHRPEVLLAGASGAIWGVLMSLVAWLFMFRSRLPADVAADWGRRLSLVVLLNAGVSLIPGISWEGHLGGGVVGFLAAALLNSLRYAPPLQRRLAAVLLLLLPVLCVGGLLEAMRKGDEWADLRRKAADLQAEHARQAAAAEEQARQEAVAAAELTWKRDVVPRLNRLAPEAVTPIDLRAVVLLARPRESRNPAAVARLRGEVAGLRTAADEVLELLSGPDVGVGRIDALRTQGREFASARSKSLAMLLELLDAPGVPTDAARAAWAKSRRAADALWQTSRPR
jgi:membrane associated rhomboid family serine protease